MKKEIREINNNIKSDAESRTIEGYAVVFDSQSEDMGFREVIHRGAITEDTINDSDIFCKFNHDDSKVLARSKNGKGSLLLEVDDKGVKYMLEAPRTELGNETLEYLRRGDITSSSFAFTVSPEKDAEKWHKEGDVLYRDIYKIDHLYDVSPVFNAAYAATTCSARALEVLEESKKIDKELDILAEEIDNL